LVHRLCNNEANYNSSGFREKSTTPT